MAQAQFARDAVMADVLRRHSQRGAVLLAGNGHVRRDLGVPRWLGAEPARVFTLGLVEQGDTQTPPGAFDATLRTAVADVARPLRRLQSRQPRRLTIRQVGAVLSL